MKREKTGGRQKGTPNKATAELREQLKLMWQKTSQLVADNNDIAQLKPSERVDFLLKLTAYIIPKPVATPQDEQGNTITQELLRIIQQTT